MHLHSSKSTKCLYKILVQIKKEILKQAQKSLIKSYAYVHTQVHVVFLPCLGELKVHLDVFQLQSVYIILKKNSILVYLDHETEVQIW